MKTLKPWMSTEVETLVLTTQQSVSGSLKYQSDGYPLHSASQRDVRCGLERWGDKLRSV